MADKDPIDDPVINDLFDGSVLNDHNLDGPDLSKLRSLLRIPPGQAPSTGLLQSLPGGDSEGDLE